MAEVISMSIKRKNEGNNARPFEIKFNSTQVALGFRTAMASTRPDLDLTVSHIGRACESETEAFSLVEAIFGPVPAPR